MDPDVSAEHEVLLMVQAPDLEDARLQAERFADVLSGLVELTSLEALDASVPESGSSDQASRDRGFSDGGVQ